MSSGGIANSSAMFSKRLSSQSPPNR